MWSKIRIWLNELLGGIDAKLSLTPKPAPSLRQIVVVPPTVVTIEMYFYSLLVNAIRGHFPNQPELTEAEKRYKEKKFLKKEDCRHLKGGSMLRLSPEPGPSISNPADEKASERFSWDVYRGPHSDYQHKDYNIMDHVFPDGSRVIKCLNCRKQWTKDSPDWKEALKMASQSSNTRTTSERVLPE